MAMQAAAMALGLVRAANSKKGQMRELAAQQEIGNRMIAMGAQLEQNDLSMQMQEQVLASKEQSIFNMDRLRETFASQNVLAATRGVERGAGTQAAMTNTSIKNFNADERARELSLMSAKRGNASAQNLSRLNQVSSAYQLNANIRQQRNASKDAFMDKFINTVGGLGDSLMSSQKPEPGAAGAPVEKRTASDGHTTDYGRKFDAAKRKR
jgi:hypothetical protein